MYNNRMNDEHHIQNEQMYRDAVRNLRKGERFRMDDLMARSDVDFGMEQFTPYDFAYVVNALHSDYDMYDRPENYMQMAKRYLKNDSYPERGDERAYYDARRRSMRYENEPMRYENRYENRRGYNERNSYRDRDNDGRYNE